jgi:hypothetical protein
MFPLRVSKKTCLPAVTRLPAIGSYASPARRLIHIGGNQRPKAIYGLLKTDGVSTRVYLGGTLMTGFLKSFLAAPPAYKTIRPQPTQPDPIHETVLLETGPLLSSNAPTRKDLSFGWDAVRVEAVVAECMGLIDHNSVRLTPPQRDVAEVYRALAPNVFSDSAG